MGADDDVRAEQDGRAAAPSPRGRKAAPTETYAELMQRLAPGTLVAGRYRIVAIAGVGGMGVVYRARDEELGVDVALKVLRQDLVGDPRVLERFRSELLSARQVTHKNVVRLHDIGEHEGMRFLTMDYVEGRSLSEILEREGRMPLDRACAIVRQVAEGLQAAHEKGIVHRDLKPGNILIDSAGHAVITDFGVARSLDRDGLTRAGGIVGTPDYLSPEQVAGDPVDGRADIYALGIVFFEALSGELPFSGGSQAEMLAQRLAGRPRDLKATGVGAPPWVREVLRRCLERSPSRRYGSAKALVEDLDRRLLRRARPVRRAALAAGLAGLAALLAAGLWVLARPRVSGKSAAVAPAPAPRRAVAVLPFADQTGEKSLAWAGSGIAEMLSANLSESPNLRVLDSVRVARGVRDLRVPPGLLDETLARQLSELWSVDSLVTGTVRRAGPRVRVDVAVLQPAASGSPTQTSFGAEGNGEAEIFRVAADLGGELKRRLGVRETRSDAAGLQTASLAAARAYEEGKGLLTRGDELTAAPAFERAVAADPRFAAALEKLAETYQSLGFHEKALQAAERAAAAAGGGETRSAWRVRARLALVRGDPAEAEKSYRQLLRRYPNDTEQQLDLASAQAAQGHNADAVETLKAVVAVDPNDPRAWLLLGRSTIATGDSPRAIQDYLVRALALQTQLGNQKGKADVLAATARAYQNLNDFPKALESFTAARSIQSAIGDDRGLAGTLRGRALILQAMGKLREAETDLQASRDLYEKIGDRAGVAAAWNASGVIEEARGNYGPALEAYQNALKLRRALGDERLLAQSYDNIGYIYYLQGQYDNGLVFWQQALDLRRKIGGKSGIVLSLQNLGFLATAQGRWDEATKLFAEALEKSRETSQKDAIVVSLGNLGILQGLRGRFSAALSSFDEALGNARQMQFQGALVEFTLKKAALLFDLGRGEDASSLLGEASKWVAETGNSEQGADLEVLRAEWSLSEGHRDAAKAASRRALPLAKKSGSRATLLEARITAASSSAPADARALAAALAEAESVGHSLLTIRAAETLARAELTRGRLREAERHLRRAVEVAERAGWAAGLYRLYALQARISEGLGEKAAAASTRGKGAAQIAKIRNELPAELRLSFDNLPAVREILHETEPGTAHRQPETEKGNAP